MRAFRTLRAALAGDEAEEQAYFAYCAALRIAGDGLDFDEISRTLGVEATHAHRKGDKQGPRSPGFPTDMWSYTPPVPEDRPLAEHIDALWSQIRHAKAFLRGLKGVATVDVFLGYRSNVDHAGVEVPHTSLEMFTQLEIPIEPLAKRACAG
jgi:hypothetical protein